MLLIAAGSSFSHFAAMYLSLSLPSVSSFQSKAGLEQDYIKW